MKKNHGNNHTLRQSLVDVIGTNPNPNLFADCYDDVNVEYKKLKKYIVNKYYYIILIKVVILQNFVSYIQHFKYYVIIMKKKLLFHFLIY